MVIQELGWGIVQFSRTEYRGARTRTRKRLNRFESIAFSKDAGIPVVGTSVNDFPTRPFEYEYEKNQCYKFSATMIPDDRYRLGS